MTTVQISWRDDVLPIDTDVEARDVALRSSAMVRARRHLAVEIGGRKALGAAHKLGTRLERLAARAAKDGLRLQISTSNQTDAPEPWDRYDGLAVLVRAIRGSVIVWSVSISSRGEVAIVRTSANAYRMQQVMVPRADLRVRVPSARTDVIVRRASAQSYVEEGS
jgi:hypothetical protein